MNDRSPVAFVSGGNRGIGLALVGALRKKLGPEAHILLGSRSLEAGKRAAETLSDEGLEATPISFDLTNPETHAKTAELLAKLGGVDIVVLNGAYAPQPDRPASDQVRTMIAANNHGNLAALETLAPLLRANARVLVVASGFGTLDNLPEAVRGLLGDPEATPEQIEAVMDDYVEAVESDQAGDQGWPEWINLPSKVAQVATVRAFVRRYDSAADRPAGVLINAVCPGWTDTDAARPYLADMPDITPQTPDEAAVDLVWLATRPAGTSEPHGELVQHRQVVPFEQQV